MNKTQTKPATISEGWAVHVYDSERHLRFILEPSHMWAFSWGVGAGIVVALVWSALHSVSANLPTNSRSLTELSPTELSPAAETAPAEDLSPRPARSFPFGID